MNPDGSDLVQLTDNTVNERFPRLSTDGSKITYQIWADDIYGDIYVMDADGSNPMRLTNSSLEGTKFRHPRLSPDGKKIVYSSRKVTETNQQIYVMNADGSDRVQLTETDDCEIWANVYAQMIKTLHGPLMVRRLFIWPKFMAAVLICMLWMQKGQTKRYSLSELAPTHGAAQNGRPMVLRFFSPILMD